MVGPDPILAKHHEKEMRGSYLAANLQGHDNACMQHYGHVENESLQCTQPNVSACCDDARANSVSSAHPDSTIWAQVKVRQKSIFTQPLSEYIRRPCMGEWDEIREPLASDG